VADFGLPGKTMRLVKGAQSNRQQRAAMFQTSCMPLAHNGLPRERYHHPEDPERLEATPTAIGKSGLGLVDVFNCY